MTRGRQTVQRGLAGWVLRGWERWLDRRARARRRAAKREMFILETMVLGPKQRLVLLRCGPERFLVGLGAEGVTSVVRVEPLPASPGRPFGEIADLDLNGDEDARWG